MKSHKGILEKNLILLHHRDVIMEINYSEIKLILWLSFCN